MDEGPRLNWRPNRDDNPAGKTEAIAHPPRLRDCAIVDINPVS